MDIDSVKQNIENFTRREKQRLARERQEEDVSSYDPYQTAVSRSEREQRRSYPRGSSEQVTATATEVIEGAGQYEGLADKRAEVQAQIETLQKQGDARRADLLREQYMREEFLPAVEVVANAVSPDELLNNASALKQLDAQAISGGRRRMDGYTAAYIRSAYGNVLGQASTSTDEEVADGIRTVNSLMDEGNVSAAKGMATRLRERIDNGEQSASEDDYALLTRLAVG